MVAIFPTAATAFLLGCMHLMGAAVGTKFTPGSTSATPGATAALIAAIQSGASFPERRPLSLHGVAPNAICGADTRVASAEANVCKMYLQTTGGTYVCSAWVVGRKKLATAGHCVVDHDAADGYISAAVFSCGGKGNAAPFYTATNWVVYPSYMNAPASTNGVYKTDAAVVRIAETFPTSVKAHKFGDLDAGLRCQQGKAAITVNGYPADSTPPCSFNGIKQWGSTGKLTCGSVFKGMYKLNADSCGGGSGSRLIDAGSKVVSIFTAQYTNNGECITNLGTRLLDGGTGVQDVDGVYLKPLIDAV